MRRTTMRNDDYHVVVIVINCISRDNSVGAKVCISDSKKRPEFPSGEWSSVSQKLELFLFATAFIPA